MFVSRDKGIQESMFSLETELHVFFLFSYGCCFVCLIGIAMLRPNKKRVFRVTVLKLLGRVGTHISFYFFWKKI